MKSVNWNGMDRICATVTRYIERGLSKTLIYLPEAEQCNAHLGCADTPLDHATVAHRGMRKIIDKLLQL